MKKNILTVLLAGTCALGTSAVTPNGLTIFINPGHGGHESNDRNVVIAPYAQGDPNGYWESNSNLEKGLALRDMLEAKGYKVVMSRVTNTEDDDLNLSTIVRLGNQSNADLYFSIHSNATGVAARRNQPLMLYRGYDNAPENPEAKVVAEILNRYLLQNQATYWTGTSLNLRGDWSFYPSWGLSGLGALRGLTVTGMLSEGSFHDYIPETYRLMNKDFCWLEAWHFRKTVDEYFKKEGVDYGAVIGRINDTRLPREGAYLKFGDDTFATIQGAKVELYDESGKLAGTYTTDPVHINGLYFFGNLKPGKYTVKASVDTHYPVETDIEVVANEVSYANLKMGRVRSTPPVVEAVTPQWKEGDEALLCNTPVTVQFNWDMDTEATEKAISFNPPVEGVFTWEDLNYRLVFTPTKAYETNTLYTVTISTEAAHAGGMKMEKPYTFQFATTDRNFMEVLGQFPKENEEVHFHNAAIELRFDKYPNVSPILNQITCTDDAGNAVAFNRRGMTSSKAGAPYGFVRIPFSKDLEPGKTYHLNVSGQVADKDGITIKDPIEVAFKAVDAGEAKDLEVIDTFDSVEAYEVDHDQAVELASASVALDKKLHLMGTACVGYTYAFNGTEGGEVLWTRKAGEETKVTNKDVIGVHVDGDLTGNELYLQFSSELGIQYAPVCDLDFLGWRYYEVPLTTLEGGVEYTFSGVKIVQLAGQASVGGTVRLDDVVMASKGAGGVADVELESITLYPNPVSEYLIANAGVVIESVSLVNMAGATVAETAGNVLNVSEIPAGSYVALVKTAAGTTKRKVIVKH